MIYFLIISFYKKLIISILNLIEIYFVIAKFPCVIFCTMLGENFTQLFITFEIIYKC